MTMANEKKPVETPAEPENNAVIGVSSGGFITTNVLRDTAGKIVKVQIEGTVEGRTITINFTEEQYRSFVALQIKNVAELL